MASSSIKPGILVSLQDLYPSSPFFKQGASLRVTGKLKIDTRHLRDLNLRIGSIYQFIGELLIQSNNEAILEARVGRNVDGMDLNLYYQSLQLLRQFQSNHTSDQAT
ncbi:PREDICTED: CST complex subunit TEN1 isoform X2 [Nelumbo nucifera]|uniref:CST complex subunit TEN1 isoform X2 n=1 Tax=Nelumbo nucifera TaxID=4432 RepID=A0A1U7ZDK5_NELNU|nr:PREDICTED: CST complex subunit TEN1 isoform X2 [Nelumbo nucifera]